MRRLAKTIAVGLLGPRTLGRLDYVLKRKPEDPFGGPLNAQNLRQRIYSDIMDRGNFEAIVETGTFRGTTTEFFARAGLPVYSVEIDLREHGFASQRLSHLRDRVHLFHGNSPEFLQTLAGDSAFPKSNVFFYLDAHVQNAQIYHKAPLVEELEIIFANWDGAVVMVDDFQVPETTYSFDDWGQGKNLDMACLEALKHLELSFFFPAFGPEYETGAKRGCVVICRNEYSTVMLRNIRNLRPHRIL
jgi:hypothetical protein